MTSTGLPLFDAIKVSRAVRQKRESKRDAIRKYFSERIGIPQGSSLMHQMFGPAFRSRCSEINRDQSESITIRNITIPGEDGVERSIYRAELRGRIQ